ncbi:MAG: efflux RND transporter permease subunit [Pseudomonadota bacterium]|jgi:multidrug efflux pump subunit AcrB
MWLIRTALRHPISMAVLAVALTFASLLSLTRTRIDILPDLNAPVIYVAQPYGGMSPQQIEGFVSYYYEYHFLYIDGIDTVQAKSIQGASLLRLTFHPGTNMSEALAETVSYVNRARAFMPPGTVAPFVVRYDAGTLPVGYLVFSSPTKTLGEIQDVALNKVRPVFGTLPGVSSPPPFGGNQRTILLNVDPNKLRGFGLSSDELLQALVSGNSIQPAGSVNIGTTQTLVTTDSTATSIDTLLDIPVRSGPSGAVYMRDVAAVADGSDLPAGYALINGKRTVYIPVTKRASASTISVVNEVKSNLAKFQSLLPDDVTVSYQLDQSKYVTDALWAVVREGALGAGLVGLTILLFLGSWRSAVIVVAIIPVVLLTAVIGLWLAGQTINIMTLGGLALAIGILVDEGVVLLEHIDFHRAGGKPLARAVLDASGEVAVPRLLAMMCIVAVFLPAFFMSGPAQALFLPLSLAVAFAMAASYLLFTIFVPILSNWLGDDRKAREEAHWYQRIRGRYAAVQKRLDGRRSALLIAYAMSAVLVVAGASFVLRTELFPSSAANEVRLRMDAPDGTRIAMTERQAQDVLKIVDQEAGAGNVDLSLSYIGGQPSSYPVNLVFLWTAGSHEAIMNISLKPGSSIALAPLIARLRQVLPQRFPGSTFSFEPGDLVSQILGFGSSTVADVAVMGGQYKDVAGFAQKLKERLAAAPELADVKFGQSLHYPNVDVRIDRIAAGDVGVTADKVARAVAAGTASSRFITPNYWRDPKSGISYQVQLQVPQPKMTSVADVGNLPVTGTDGSSVLLSQVAQLRQQAVPGELDRQNGQWVVSVTANLAKADVGRAASAIDRAIADIGAPPKGVSVQVRGQVDVMRGVFGNLGIGLGAAILVMLLLLTANFQSIRLALIALSAVPAGLMGSLVMLAVTGTSLNLESFMGIIMVVGVALANAILLVTFAEHNRRAGKTSFEAAYLAADERLRPILMTSLAMIAGMLPMALAIGQGAQETAPLGRAVIGGLLFATAATLIVLPIVFGLVQRGAALASVSLHPDDHPDAQLVEQPQ